MANLLSSSQVSSTTAPGFYTDYLSNLASSGQAAQKAAQYAGTQPLQQEAFTNVAQNVGAFQPSISSGQQLVGQAAGQDITGAAQPYLQAGTAVNPLTTLQPYAQSAMGTTGVQTASPMVGAGADMSGLGAEIGRAHV